MIPANRIRGIGQRLDSQLEKHVQGQGRRVGAQEPQERGPQPVSFFSFNYTLLSLSGIWPPDWLPR